MYDLRNFLGKKILVTGHTGFKGSWLSLWLSSLGAQVYGISLPPITSPSNYYTSEIHREISNINLDIRDPQVLNNKILEIQPDFIFHLAAQALVRKSYDNSVLTWASNTFGTINLMEAMRNLQNKCVAILITSDKCYENVEWIWGYRENDRLGGSDPYSASKAATELAIKSYVDSFFKKENSNIRIAVARAGNVIGGGDWSEDRVVPDAIRAWSIGNQLTLRSPSSTRPWQHVLEPLGGYLVLALSLNENLSLHGEAFNFGPTGEEAKPVSALVDVMSKHWGDGARWKSCLDMHAFKEANLLQLNCDKARSLLSWRPIWNFDKTVENTAIWYKSYYDNKDLSTSKISLKQIQEFTEDGKYLGVFK